MTPSQDWRWQSRAACMGMSSEVFFPSSTSHTENDLRTMEAQRVCLGCVVSAECRASAKTSNNGRREQHGIWAGVNMEKKQRFENWDLTCRVCLRDFQYPSGRGQIPAYCDRPSCQKRRRQERNARYRGNAAAVGL